MTDFTASHTRSAPFCTPRAVKASGLLHLIALWRQRKTLAALDDHLLADIGVTRAQAQTEANRPVWDVPHAWRA